MYVTAVIYEREHYVQHTCRTVLIVLYPTHLAWPNLLSCQPRVTVTMFCLQSYQGLIIHRSFVYLSYPKDRINTQAIYQFVLAQVKSTCLCFT